jgi:hypothetical protein
MNIGFRSRGGNLSETNSWQSGNGHWHVPKRGVFCHVLQALIVNTPLIVRTLIRTINQEIHTDIGFVAQSDSVHARKYVRRFLFRSLKKVPC